MRKLILAALLMAASQASSAAAVYHVAPSGSDEHAGTKDQPFRTIQHAADRAQPGDTVLVAAGLYAEAVTVPRSGAAGKPITFEGERGSGGEWLSVIDRSVPVRGWKPAPEIAPGVFRCTLPFLPANMTLDDKQIARVSDVMMKGEGMENFALPADDRSADAHGDDRMNFWDGIEVIFGTRDGVTYIRFRNGDDPNGRALKAAPAGGGFTLLNRSHIVVRGFTIRGAQDSIIVEGELAQHNVIEGNRLLNGRSRVTIKKGAAHTLVRNNEMTLNYHGHDSLGAWGTSQPTPLTQARYHVYRVFKKIVGPNTSDDHGVLVQGAGDGNEIAGNHIYGGLIGISSSRVRSIQVHHNRIHNMSSVGLVTINGVVDGRFHENVVDDCNIALRIHRYNTAGDNDRREYHYRNRFSGPAGVGHNIFVHWLGATWPANTQHAQVWIYENELMGAGSGIAPSGLSNAGGGLPRTRIIGNVFLTDDAVRGNPTFNQTRSMLGSFDFNLVVAGPKEPTPAWWGSRNRVIPAPPKGRQAVETAGLLKRAGLDISRPFELDGVTYPPLPASERVTP
jgi:hypothetical protein